MVGFAVAGIALCQLRQPATHTLQLWRPDSPE